MRTSFGKIGILGSVLALNLSSVAALLVSRPARSYHYFPAIQQLDIHSCLTPLRPDFRTTLSTRQMTTAYRGEPGDGTAGVASLSFIPYNTSIRGDRQVEVGPFLESEWERGMELMNLIIREGKSWPFEEEFLSVDAYRGYFLSHAAFVVRSLEAGLDNEGNASPAGDLLGCFYIKPNYPGRCSHICNGGFITAPNFRSMGVARLMGKIFLRAARDLGYKSAYFNLVFKSNAPSVALWESLGFQRVAVLENAARLEGVEGLDTAYGYRYDLDTLKENESV